MGSLIQFILIVGLAVLCGTAMGATFQDVDYWRTLTNAEKQRLITPDDFEYVGAFHLPTQSFGPNQTRFTNSGKVLAHRPDGDPDGSGDGFPGSLYSVGRGENVAEISIPAPVKASSPAPGNLPQAEFLQTFADVTGGIKNQTDPRIRGLRVLDAPGIGTKIFWVFNKWYNVSGDDIPGHGYSDLDLSNPNAKGAWRLDGVHIQRSGGYLVTAPQAWADQHTGGRRLLAGLNVAQGSASTSAGPAFYAYAPWLEPTVPPPANASLSNVPLVYYPDGTHEFPGYLVPDAYDAAAWLTDGTREGVIVTGHNAGALYYGVGRPGDCSGAKGYHGDPYNPQCYIYDPEDLAKAAAGNVEPWEVLPYLAFDPRPHIYESCQGQLNGAAFDFENRLLYILQPKANGSRTTYESVPLVHVFRIGSTSPVSWNSYNKRIDLGATITAAPNPFRTKTSVIISNLSSPNSATVEIFNVHGKLIHVLPPTELVWNAADQPNGIYIIKARMGENVLSGRVTLLR
jgi:hypothetical protein